eukprot:scaffold910_cov370-Pavlova_lutheri.AAC.3
MAESMGASSGSQERLLERGRVCLVRGAWEEASDTLGRALAEAVQQHGEMHPHTAPFYVAYADALFALAKQEADVFQGSSKGKEKEGSEEKEAVPDEEEEEEEEGGAGGEEGETAEHAEEEDDDEEEETDLDLAWKMLEVAKLIYIEKGNEHVLELVDVHLKLAEVSLEREDYDACMVDLDRAIELLEAKEDADDRTLASVFFRKATALQLQGELPDALENCLTAIRIFEDRCIDLQLTLRNSSDMNHARKLQTREEVDEMEDIIDELRSKADELREALKMEEKAKVALKQAFGLPAETKERPSMEPTPVESTGFDAPKLNANTAPAQVKNLGVVGRGKSRVTPVQITPMEGNVQEPHVKSAREKGSPDVLSVEEDVEQAQKKRRLAPSKGKDSA